MTKMKRSIKNKAVQNPQVLLRKTRIDLRRKEGRKRKHERKKKRNKSESKRNVKRKRERYSLLLYFIISVSYE